MADFLPDKDWWRSYFSFVRGITAFGAALILLGLIALSVFFFQYHIKLFPHTALYTCLVWSVFLLNWYTFGFSSAVNAFVVLGIAIGASNFSLVFLTGYFGDPTAGAFLYAITWGVGATWCFVRPLLSISGNIENIPGYHLPMVFALVIFCSLSSAYIPMRLTNNAIIERFSSNELSIPKATQQTNWENEQSIIAFQETRVFRRVERPSTYCATVLRQVTANFIQPDDYAVHATTAFWLDQFLSPLRTAKPLENCWLTDFEIRSEASSTSVAAWVYFYFVLFSFGSILFDILAKARLYFLSWLK